MTNDADYGLGPLVELDRVTVRFGSDQSSVLAIDEASGIVLPRDRIGLVGPSGSGKSTLLHVMAGLEAATTGNTRWPSFDSSPSGRPGLVGVVFQGDSLIPVLNVAENVALPLILAGVHERDALEQSREALARLDVESLSQQLPDELSGGQSQRVAIARVLAMRPRLILADEPTGQLDSQTGSHVLDVLVETADLIGAALVVTTHDPSIADRLETRWLMKDGHLMHPDQPTSTHDDTVGSAR